MALYTRGLGAVEITPYGRVFKYADVPGTGFSGYCSQYQNKEALLASVEREIREQRARVRSSRGDYEFYLKQKNMPQDSFSYVYAGREPELYDHLNRSRTMLVERYKALGGLLRLLKDIRADKGGQDGPITVCFYENVWVEAHEKMHALLNLASGAIMYERALDARQQGRFNSAIKMLLHDIGFDVAEFESIFSRGLNDPLRTYEELLAGIVGIAQISEESLKGRISEDAARNFLEDALSSFESYLNAKKLYGIPAFRERMQENAQRSGHQLHTPYLQTIADFYYPAANEFRHKYRGDLVRVASDFKRFYDRFT